METIHKKDGRLHIYVRQDKYKGELKSHNWVGRTYINGKQKVISSGTTNLEEAIPILEKWFDELQLEKNDNIQKNPANTPENQAQQEQINTPPPLEQPTKEVVKETSAPTVDGDIQSPKNNVAIGMLDKIKNFKLSNLKSSSADNASVVKTKNNKAKEFFQKFFQSQV